MTDLEFDRPPAVVVGVCGHGLAIVRALHGAGVPVVALEANADLPGARTRMARVLMVPSIHGLELIDALEALASRIVAPGPPVLFLTNDRMVRTLGEQWPRLEGRYALSWATARARLTPLLDKPALEERCRATQVAYPETFVLEREDQIEHTAQIIGFPMIAKPARPLSGFKTALPDDITALRGLVARHGADLPFLVQRYIPGDDTRIHFCALYLDRGRVLARFDGHKLRSRPMGHTSIAEPLADDAVHAHTLRFFEGLALSGPVSLELKRDVDDSLWVIEPTVGRTDFWVDLCVANGVNLPLVEYLHQTGQAVPPQTQRNDCIWFNEDRDPLGRWWVAAPPRRAMRGRGSRYVYLHAADPAPTGAYLRKTLAQWSGAVARRVRRALGRTATPAAPEPDAAPLSEWPHSAAGAAQETRASHPFATPGWFALLQSHCGTGQARALLPSATDHGGTTHLPLLERPGRTLVSLSNYYAALFSPATTCTTPPAGHAHELADWVVRHGAARLQLHPLDPKEPFWAELAQALRARHFWVDQYFTFGNWYHPCQGQDWQAYLAARPSRLRHTIQRTEKRLLSRPDCRVELITPAASRAQLRAAVAAFGQVYARSWKKPEPYLTFVPALCMHAHHQGWLRLCLCYLGDTPVSAQMWLVHKGTASIYKLAYDERFAKLGVGTLVSAAITRHVLDVDRVTEIDFLAGDDAYKSEWMSARRERTGLIAFSQRRAAGWLHATQHFGAKMLSLGGTQSRWEGRSSGRQAFTSLGPQKSRLGAPLPRTIQSASVQANPTESRNSA